MQDTSNGGTKRLLGILLADILPNHITDPAAWYLGISLNSGGMGEMQKGVEGLSRRVQCLATWGTTGLSFCPSRSGYVADVCIDNFWPVCPPALHTAQEVKEKAGLLSGVSCPPTRGPVELVWMCLHIWRKGFCLKGSGRQARECSSVTTPS